jgi:IS4 transposase
VPRSQLSAQQIVQAYRLRWRIELLFREIKQATDLGRSFTGDVHALQAMTYGAMLAHVLVRSLRIQAALDNEIPLEQLRPLACLSTSTRPASKSA